MIDAAAVPFIMAKRCRGKQCADPVDQLRSG
jgi:hypothetical protein